MAPEQGTMNTNFLDEAVRIKNALMVVQGVVQHAAEITEAELLANIRDELGYVVPDLVDTTDLIDTNIASTTMVITPRVLAAVLPITKNSAETTRASRQNIVEILTDKSDRLAVVIGPCSLHDPDAALQYATWVKTMREKYGNNLEIVMRAYMEKPRTELGWKGLIYDPRLNDSCDINLGVVAARMLACQITDMGVPIAMERLNANTPQYVNGLVSYDTIGARNTTDQKSREYASGTSSPVGFKNTPEGSVGSAAEAVITARAPHTFLGTHMGGVSMQVKTLGNEAAHIILRGDQHGPNFGTVQIARAKELLRSKGLKEVIGVDASHGNSYKNPLLQLEVVQELSRQIALGELAIRLVMIESNLVGGKQDHKAKLLAGEELTFGQSITDGCADLADSEQMLGILAESTAKKRETATTT